jgi:hypothetical protein
VVRAASRGNKSMSAPLSHRRLRVDGTVCLRILQTHSVRVLGFRWRGLGGDSIRCVHLSSLTLLSPTPW